MNKNKARELCLKVKELCKEYDASFFFVTEGASICSNRDCEAVKNARDKHKEWEIKNNYDPLDDWSKKSKKNW